MTVIHLKGLTGSPSTVLSHYDNGHTNYLKGGQWSGNIIQELFFSRLYFVKTVTFTSSWFVLLIETPCLVSHYFFWVTLGPVSIGCSLVACALAPLWRDNEPLFSLVAVSICCILKQNKGSLSVWRVTREQEHTSQGYRLWVQGLTSKIFTKNISKYLECVLKFMWEVIWHMKGLVSPNYIGFGQYGEFCLFSTNISSIVKKLQICISFASNMRKQCWCYFLFY